MNYKKWLIEDLQQLDRCRFSIVQMTEELQTLEAEFSAIKATNYDKQPGGSGDNIQEEKLLTSIAKRDELRSNLKYTKRKVADMERLLSQLPTDERRVVERMFIGKEKYAGDNLAEELDCDTTTVYRIKNRALLHLAQMRYGFAYQT